MNPFDASATYRCNVLTRSLAPFLVLVTGCSSSSPRIAVDAASTTADAPSGDSGVDSRTDDVGARSFALDAAETSAPLAYDPTAVPTYIDDDAGSGNGTYSYSPTIAQTAPSLRYVFYCGDSITGLKGESHDHVMLSVGSFTGSAWTYAAPVVAFGPEGAPAYASFHTCDPSHVGGSFAWSGHTYSWAMFFTATGTGTGQNQVGVAFADAPEGPWALTPAPFISEEMEFGSDASTWPDWGLGHPSALSVDAAGKILLFYKLGTGPEIGRLIDLSDVGSPVFLSRWQVTESGLPPPVSAGGTSEPGGVFHSAEFAYDASRDLFFLSLDTGRFNPSSVGPNVQPDITVAVLDRDDLLAGTGSWQVLDTFGMDLSSETYNANSGIVRDVLGSLPDSSRLGVFFTVSDPTISHGARGVFENRLWDAEGAL
jgi:hypothetical protein